MSTYKLTLTLFASFLLGAVLGTIISGKYYQKEIIQRECGYYHHKTKEFKWGKRR